MSGIQEFIDLELLNNEKNIYWANIDLLKKFIPKKIKNV
jgi:hypothetical protein